MAVTAGFAFIGAAGDQATMNPVSLAPHSRSSIRLFNGLVALSLLPAMIRACERAAALVPEDQRAALYADASRARALLAETP